MQDLNNIVNGQKLFQKPEYQEVLKGKAANFEGRPAADKVAEVAEQGVACFLAPKPVQGAVRENALKQHGQLGCRLVAVVLGQAQHAVLHDVQSGLLVAHVVKRAFVRSFFHAFEKVRKFLFRCQD